MTSPIYICGPTASGKTSLAIALAKDLGGEIVNADAYQIYKGLETISAAPDEEEKAQAPHHLFSVLEPTDLCDAMQYRELALPIIADIQERGKTPIITGGSGLYLKFLTHGPSPVPPGDQALRDELEKRDDASLIAELETLDPEGAAQTNLKNRRYVIRALEICLLSGEKMSKIKSDWKKTSDEKDKDLRGLVIQWDAEALRTRIQSRTDILLARKASAEVTALRGIASETCRKAIGFREIEQMLDKDITREKCLYQVSAATSRYAKRQRTWFRKETWLKPIPAPATLEKAKELLQL